MKAHDADPFACDSHYDLASYNHDYDWEPRQAPVGPILANATSTTAQIQGDLTSSDAANRSSGWSYGTANYAWYSECSVAPQAYTAVYEYQYNARLEAANAQAGTVWYGHAGNSSHQKYLSAYDESVSYQDIWVDQETRYGGSMASETVRNDMYWAPGGTAHAFQMATVTFHFAP